jgi:hypothetical protein
MACLKADNLLPGPSWPTADIPLRPITAIQPFWPTHKERTCSHKPLSAGMDGKRPVRFRAEITLYQTFVFKGPSNQDEKGEQFLNQSGEESLPAP